MVRRTAGAGDASPATSGAAAGLVPASDAAVPASGCASAPAGSGACRSKAAATLSGTSNRPAARAAAICSGLPPRTAIGRMPWVRSRPSSASKSTGSACSRSRDRSSATGSWSSCGSVGRAASRSASCAGSAVERTTATIVSAALRSVYGAGGALGRDVVEAAAMDRGRGLSGAKARKFSDRDDRAAGRAVR